MEDLVPHDNTTYVTLEIMPAVGMVAVNQVLWAGSAEISPGITEHFSGLPCLSEY